MINSIYYQPYWLNENELEHYGIKGMKWGVRKQKEQASISKRSEKKLK